MSMKLRNIIMLSIVALAALAVSCKKEEETETKPSLSGMYFQVIPYLRIGQEVTVTPLEVTHPEGKGVGYYWMIDSEQRDTVKKENAAMPASLSKTVSFTEQGTHTIYCAAFADGYYSATYSATVTVVDPEWGGMITENGLENPSGFVVDTRASSPVENRYYYTHIGSLDWMMHNLAYTGSGVPYMESEVTSYPLGRYYTWEEAQTACPYGWRLPTMAEWKGLGTTAGDFMVDAKILGNKFWEFWPKVKITNSLKLCVIPSGYAMTALSTKVFKGLGDYAAFWSSDTNPDDAEQGSYVYIHEQDAAVQYGHTDKSSVGFSVRCVR